MREPNGYYGTINRYCFRGGVWKDDFGVCPSFTKDDVKKIYADHERKCTIVLLKDGTEINPDFVCGGIYEERTEAWKQKILRYKGKTKSTRKDWKPFKVYEQTIYGSMYIGDTFAKSEAHAVNNVRYRTYGLTVNNEPFWAKEEINRKTDLSSFHWYAIEYCVADGGSGYYQPWAQYAVVLARSLNDAKSRVNNEWSYLSEFEKACRLVYFGRTEEFEHENEARQCAKNWRLSNKEEKKQYEKT